jgi:hypothetical protein
MPLTIIAAASAAVQAIQQGCDLYKEYKGVVLKAKETFDEAKENIEEVIGLWGFIKSKLFPNSKEKEVIPSVVNLAGRYKNNNNRQQPPKSELTITTSLIENLKVFFRCLEQLEAKVREAEEASLDESANYLESAINIEYAMSEVQKLQKQIRETMVYQSPMELGDLYNKVVTRVGVIKEQQEVAHLLKLRKRRDEQWRQQRMLSKVRHRIAMIVVMVLIIFTILKRILLQLVCTTTITNYWL